MPFLAPSKGEGASTNHLVDLAYFWSPHGLMVLCINGLADWPRHDGFLQYASCVNIQQFTGVNYA